MMPRRKALDADSRSYIIAWVIRSEDDLPADFPIPEGAKNFQVGLFLPRDDSGRFGRSHYPPRVVLLQDDAMVALTHPAHDDKPARIALGDLAFCEFGHFLLIGWLRFVAAGHEIRLPYNTRCQQPVDEFLDALLRAWLGADKTDRDGGIAEFGAPLDIKFKTTWRRPCWRGRAFGHSGSARHRHGFGDGGRFGFARRRGVTFSRLQTRGLSGFETAGRAGMTGTGVSLPPLRCGAWRACGAWARGRSAI